jgi:hypothetical protein
VFPDKVLANLTDTFHYISDLSSQFAYYHLKFPQPAGPNNIVFNLIKIFDTFVVDWCQEGATVPTDCEEKIINAIIFSATWAVGGMADEHTRNNFNVFMLELVNGEDVIEKYKIDLVNSGLPAHDIRKLPHRLGEVKSLYDWFFERDSCQWTPWGKTVNTFEIPTASPYSEMIVPTVDSIRIKGIFNRCLSNDTHTLVIGPTGTGKSIMINQELRERYNDDEYTFISMAFSAQTTANQT